MEFHFAIYSQAFIIIVQGLYGSTLSDTVKEIWLQLSMGVLWTDQKEGITTKNKNKLACDFDVSGLNYIILGNQWTFQ